MWSRSYRILDFRADPQDILHQLGLGYFPGVRLIVDKPIGTEIRVTIESMNKRDESYAFTGYLDEDVYDFSLDLRFYRETNVTGCIFYWKGQLTMSSSMNIERGTNL